MTRRPHAAARLIDRQPFRGSKLDSAQALAFPRDYTDGVPLEVKHAQIETAYWFLTDYWHRRSADESKTLDLGNFLAGGGDGPNGALGIKLAVSGVTVEDGGESTTRKISFAPVERAPIPQLPTELPPAALLLLKDHLATGITLDR